MAAIRKQYNYDKIHDTTSTQFILKELAGADELRNMKLAPAPNVNKANAVQKYKSTLEDISWSNSNSSFADSSSSSCNYSRDVKEIMRATLLDGQHQLMVTYVLGLSYVLT